MWIDRWWLGNAGRLDRNPFYVCIIVGLQYLSFSIMLDPTPPRSVVQDAPRPLQIGMCGCMFIGSLIAVYGLATGSKYFRRNTKRSTSYKYAYTAMPATVAGMSYYTLLIILSSEDLFDLMARCIIPLLGVAHLIYGVYFWLEVRRIERAETNLTRAVVEDMYNEA